jgi:hypothetical protein
VESWFSNTGQLLTLIVGLLGLGLNLLKAWQDLKTLKAHSADRWNQFVKALGWKRASLILICSTVIILSMLSFSIPRDPKDFTSIRIVGFNLEPLQVGQPVTVNLVLRNESKRSVKAIGVYTVRYLARIPFDAAERASVEDSLWKDFLQKPPAGPEVPMSVPSMQDYMVPHRSTNSLSPEVLKGLENGGAVYVFGTIRIEGSNETKEYCVYGLYNPQKLGACVNHN